jgi:Ca2+-binding EF-hand superfamily protein
MPRFGTLADTLALALTNLCDVYWPYRGHRNDSTNEGSKMTRTTRLLLTTGALALGAAAFAGASLANGGWGDRHHGGSGLGGPGENLFEAFDANQDGKLTQAEVDQARAAKLAEFDADGNGSLSLEEYQALWLDAMRERMVDQFQAHDDDGDGEVTVVEFTERYSRIVDRLDDDDDGEVTMEELREHAMRRHHGPGGEGDRRGPRRGSDDDAG